MVGIRIQYTMYCVEVQNMVIWYLLRVQYLSYDPV